VIFSQGAGAPGPSSWPGLHTFKDTNAASTQDVTSDRAVQVDDFIRRTASFGRSMGWSRRR